MVANVAITSYPSFHEIHPPDIESETDQAVNILPENNTKSDQFNSELSLFSPKTNYSVQIAKDKNKEKNKQRQFLQL